MKRDFEKEKIRMKEYDLKLKKIDIENQINLLELEKNKKDCLYTQLNEINNIVDKIRLFLKIYNGTIHMLGEWTIEFKEGFEDFLLEDSKIQIDSMINDKNFERQAKISLKLFYRIVRLFLRKGIPPKSMHKIIDMLTSRGVK